MAKKIYNIKIVSTYRIPAFAQRLVSK